MQGSSSGEKKNPFARCDGELSDKDTLFAGLFFMQLPSVFYYRSELLRLQPRERKRLRLDRIVKEALCDETVETTKPERVKSMFVFWEHSAIVKEG